jgi:hypothetical protein
MVIKRTRFVVVVSAVALTSGLGVLCIMRIIAFRDVVECFVSACAHSGFVAIIHGFGKSNDGG